MNKITINKAMLEAAVPAAACKGDHIVDSLTSALDLEYATQLPRLLTTQLHDKFSGAQQGSQEAFIFDLFIQYVCNRAFFLNIRHLDVVLTPTGFGIVSTQDLSPASTRRVDALLDSVERKSLMLEHQLYTALFAYEGWADAAGAFLPSSLVYSYTLFTQCAGADDSPAAYRQAIQTIREADELICRHMSHQQFDALVGEVCRNAASTASRRTVVRQVRAFVSFHLVGDKVAEVSAIRYIMQIIEDNIGDFPDYASSREYIANHYKGYENTKDSTVFFFG